MSLDAFRKVQSTFIHDLTRVLGVDPSQVELVGAQPVTSDNDEDVPGAEEHIPLPWDSLPPDHPVRQSRNEQLQKVRSLAESLKQLENPLTIPEEILIRSVGAYAGRIDQFLLQQRNYPDCEIVVDLSQKPLSFHLPDGTTVPVSALAVAFSFFAKVPEQEGEKLAEAMTQALSLGSHRDVLPNVTVERNGENIVFSPAMGQK